MGIKTKDIRGLRLTVTEGTVGHHHFNDPLQYFVPHPAPPLLVPPQPDYMFSFSIISSSRKMHKHRRHYINSKSSRNSSRRKVDRYRMYYINNRLSRRE
jgi:hypothetical protein